SGCRLLSRVSGIRRLGTGTVGARTIAGRLARFAAGRGEFVRCRSRIRVAAIDPAHGAADCEGGGWTLVAGGWLAASCWVLGDRRARSRWSFLGGMLLWRRAIRANCRPLRR